MFGERRERKMKPEGFKPEEKKEAIAGVLAGREDFAFVFTKG